MFKTYKIGDTVLCNFKDWANRKRSACGFVVNINKHNMRIVELKGLNKKDCYYRSFDNQRVVLLENVKLGERITIFNNYWHQ